jgi:hypothetical protein
MYYKEYLGLERGVGENYIMRSFIICAPHLALLG